MPFRHGLMPPIPRFFRFRAKIDHFQSESCNFFGFSGRKNVKSILSRKNLRAPQFLTFIFA
ncbi:hypothetical protein SAMCFNEI73_Ch2856 [Sinorhizobium americanum]|uniref:Uncharacterized protein n=1 Tax=Sinorhizobium americanum TaxID=194963 RepID=A0A1L3LPW8_9HYPH|nr:hypothetical protein SAMCCGM7_Ch2734 [Sinorhizobium americanum CCGM7]APG92129.1 hypothetical protein SAMCFNEI73_Ch2856 [Sinorhizobium americanum]